MRNRTGPPNEVGPRDTTPEGTDTSSKATTAHQHPQRTTPGRVCQGDALRRMRRIMARTVPLDCGCRWGCHCTVAALTDKQLDGWADAARHVLDQGMVPRIPVEALRGLWKRGGQDRQLAEELHRMAGGRAA